jgi:hypothetical protein
MTESPADQTRQKIQLAQVVEHRSPDAVLNECLEHAVTLLIEAAYCLHEADHPGRLKVLEINTVMAANVETAGQ